MPNIQDTLDSLDGYVFFSVLDQSKAYHQLYMGKESRYLNAFFTPYTERKRVPLINPQTVFQGFMEKNLYCLTDYRDQFEAPYLDDVLVYSNSFEDHVSHLQLILQQFKEKGIRLKPSKSRFFQKQANFLGYIVTSEG